MQTIALRAKCPGCGKVVKGGDDWASKTAKCPGCGATITFNVDTSTDLSDPFEDLPGFVAAESEALSSSAKPVGPPPFAEPAQPQRTAPKFEYRMVQILPSVWVTKESGDAAARHLEGVVNNYAQDGWEFVRVDTIEVQTALGCLSGFRPETRSYYVLKFRRPAVVVEGGLIMADQSDDTPCPYCGSPDIGIADFGLGPETFKTGNGDDAEPASIVLRFRCEKCGG